MRTRAKRLVAAVSVLAVLTLNIGVNQSRVTPALATATKPIAPARPKSVIRRLHPSHTAITQASFTRHRHQHAAFPKRLYGPPADLRLHPAHVDGPVAHVRTNPRFLPRSNRKVANSTARRAHSRRATAGCPSGGWSCLDVGSDYPAGSSSYTGTGGSLSALSLTAGGPGINTGLTSRGTQGFHFAYQSASSANGSLSTKLTGQTQNGSSYDSAGILLRSGTGATAAYYGIVAVPKNGTTSQGQMAVEYQATDGGSPQTLSYIGEDSSAYPSSLGNASLCKISTFSNCWIAIQRRTSPTGTGEILQAFVSTSGTTWLPVANTETTISSSSPLYNTGDIGVYATSDSSGNSSTATFASVSLTSSTLLDELGTTCPIGYQCAAVGSTTTGSQWAFDGDAWLTSD